MPNPEPQALHSALYSKDPRVRIRALKQISVDSLAYFSEPVVDSLSHDDPEVQATAAFVLRLGYVPSALAPLQTALNSDVLAVRVAAIFTLGEWQSHEALPQLMHLLKDAAAVVRSRAADALKKIACKTAIPALYEALEEEDNLKVALRLSDALLALADTRVIPVLTAALAYDDSKIRARAVEILVAFPHLETIDALLVLLKGSEQSARAAAVYVLGKVGGLNPDALRSALQDPVRAVRSGVAKALGELGVAAGENTWQDLVLCLADEDHRVRIRAAQALGKLQVTAAAPHLEQSLLTDPARRVRWRAAEALYILEAKAAAPALMNSINDAYSSVRLVCIRALSDWRIAAAVPLIIEALQDSIRRVRCVAARALGEMGDYRALAPLRDALWQDTEESVRLDCTRALGLLRKNLKDTAEALLQLEEQAVLGLSDVLQDQSVRVRSEAISELVAAGAQQVCQELAEVLKDENPVLRTEVAYALGQLGGDVAQAALLETLSDNDSQVRHAAVQALLYLARVAVVFPEDLLPALLSGLQSEDKRLRTSASLVLSQLGPAVVDELLPYVEHSTPRLRASVIYVLGESGDGRALSVLTQALNDPISRVRTAAAESLEKLLHCAIQPLLDAVEQEGELKAQSIVSMGRLFHQLKPILENTSSQDPDEDMRKLASSALDGTNESIELVL